MSDDHDQLVANLAPALGFPSGDKGSSIPFIDYIQSSWPGKGTKSEYLRLFTETVNDLRNYKERHIEDYIQMLLKNEQHFYFRDSPLNNPVREMAVRDTILLILGTWSLLQSYFVPVHGRPRHILHVSQRNASPQALGQPLSRLISNSRLLPGLHEGAIQGDSSNRESLELDNLSSEGLISLLHTGTGAIESLTIEPKDLNLFKLITLAQVRVIWTDNISRHLLLSRRGQRKYIELFALPCALGLDFETIGISANLIDEIEMSYANLLNPQASSLIHKYAAAIMGLCFWCWCLSCSSKRLRKRELRILKETASRGGRRNTKQLSTQNKIPYDPLLEKLTENEATWWDQTEFENLWQRILILEKCLQEAKPWNFWVLLRDNRDSVQYWTFLFGTMILMLTVVQVILGALQVANA